MAHPTWNKDNKINGDKNYKGWLYEHSVRRGNSAPQTFFTARGPDNRKELRATTCYRERAQQVSSAQPKKQQNSRRQEYLRLRYQNKKAGLPLTKRPMSQEAREAMKHGQAVRRAREMMNFQNTHLTPMSQLKSELKLDVPTPGPTLTTQLSTQTVTCTSSTTTKNIYSSRQK